MPALDINIAVFGHSMVAGVGATGGQTFPVQLGQRPLLSDSGIVPKAIGLSGSNMAQMRGYLSYVNDMYVAGKPNVLLLWPATNSICNIGNVTGLQAAQEAKSLITLLRTGRPWEYVILLNEIPRFGSIAGTNANGQTLSVQEANAELDAYNTYVRNNWADMGAQGLVDLRAGGAFVYPPGATSCTPGSAMYPYMNTPEEGGAAVHPNNAGYGLVAQYSSTTLANVLGVASGELIQHIVRLVGGKLRLRGGVPALAR